MFESEAPERALRSPRSRSDAEPLLSHSDETPSANPTSWTASRGDMICFKLYAATDQSQCSKHYSDLQHLGPSRDELLTAARWAITHDPSAGFRRELLAAMAALGTEVSDADLD